jgi:hypothetical protein
MRVWQATPGRCRVDVLSDTGERDTYQLSMAGGAAAEIGAPLLNAVVVKPPGLLVTFLLAGTVSTQLLEQAATELTELVVSA